MYNGIGLQTPRGSGTNGYVQRNLSFVRHHKEKVEYRTEEDLKKLDAAANRRPNEDILAHQRKRNIELKCMELYAAMEEQGYKPEEIDSKVAAFRSNLLEQDTNKGLEIPKDEFGRPIAKESHQMAEAALEKNKKLKEALGISQYFVEGSSLDPDRKAKEILAKEEAKKKYELIPDPPSSPESGEGNPNSRDRGNISPERRNKNKKSKRHKHGSSSSTSLRDKKKSKKSRHHRNSSSSDSTSSDSDDSSSGSEDNSDADGSCRKHKHSKKSHHYEISKKSNDKKVQKSSSHSDSRKHSKKKRQRTSSSGESSSSCSPSPKPASKPRHPRRDVLSSTVQEARRARSSSSSSDGTPYPSKATTSQRTDHAARKRSLSPYKGSPPRKYFIKEKGFSPSEAKLSDMKGTLGRDHKGRDSKRGGHSVTKRKADTSNSRQHSRDSRSLSYSPIPNSRSRYLNKLSGSSRDGTRRRSHSSSPSCNVEGSRRKTSRDSKVIGEDLTQKHHHSSAAVSACSSSNRHQTKASSDHTQSSSKSRPGSSSSSSSSRASSVASNSSSHSKSPSDSDSESDCSRRRKKSAWGPSLYRKASTSRSSSLSPSPGNKKPGRAYSRSHSSRSSHSSSSSKSSVRSHSSLVKPRSVSPRHKKKYRSSRSPSHTSGHSRSNSKSSHHSDSGTDSSRHSSRSNHRASLTSPRSRSYSSRSCSYARSPSIPRRRGSPSFLDKRRITRSPRHSPRRRYSSYSTAHSRDRKDYKSTHRYSDTSRSHDRYR